MKMVRAQLYRLVLISSAAEAGGKEIGTAGTAFSDNIGGVVEIGGGIRFGSAEE